MSALLQLGMPFATGLMLGVCFFAGLWWTIQRGLQAANPGVWFSLSALLRMSLVLLGLFPSARSGLASLLACVAGIVVARIAAGQWAGLAGKRSCI